MYDLNFEYKAGKVPDTDYQSQHAWLEEDSGSESDDGDSSLHHRLRGYARSKNGEHHNGVVSQQHCTVKGAESDTDLLGTFTGAESYASEHVNRDRNDYGHQRNGSNGCAVYP